MENLASDPLQETVAVDGDDEIFYEEIEAPKFVDFTAPADPPRRDDRSWFCVRVGCDQTHEDVDPDALNRSFLLRVMAARSPNILRLRKTLNGQAPSLIPRCPNSAPVKPPKDRITRLSTMTSVAEKIANKKMNDHPISKLRSIPKAQPTPPKRAVTAPRSKKCASNLEPFRSVKHQKEAIVAPKNASVVKALFTSTPKNTEKKNASTSPTPVSEVCAEMKKLHIGSLKKNETGGQVCKSSRGAAYFLNNQTKSSSLARKPQKKVAEAKVCPKNTIQEGFHSKCSDLEVSVKNGCRDDSLDISITDVDDPPSLAVSVVEDTTKTSDEESEEKVPVDRTTNESGPEKQMMADSMDTDDNKENDSQTYSTSNENLNTTESETSRAETSENVLQEGIRTPRKSFQERPTQGAKCRKLKSTNPKPFRLRTDERGILKEANLERRLQIEAQKETAQLVNQIVVDNVQKKVKPTRTKIACVKLVRPLDPKMATHSPPCQKSMQLKNCKEKRTENSEKIAKVASSSLIAVKKVSVSKLGGKLATTLTLKASASNEARAGFTTTRPFSSKVKKLATIPKEPTFHRMHLPKSCTKRLEIAFS